jgi:site-specific DNA-cytosine methylase
MYSFRYASFFCGAGFLDSGMIEAANKDVTFEPVYAIDRDAIALQYYKEKFPNCEVVQGNLQDTVFPYCPDWDAIVASPPVFTIPGSAIAYEGEYDRILAEAMVNAIAKTKVPLFVLEAPPQYASFHAFKLLFRSLMEMGYFVSAYKFNLCEFGDFQDKARLVMLAAIHTHQTPLFKAAYPPRMRKDLLTKNMGIPKEETTWSYWELAFMPTPDRNSLILGDRTEPTMWQKQHLDLKSFYRANQSTIRTHKWFLCDRLPSFTRKPRAWPDGRPSMPLDTYDQVNLWVFKNWQKGRSFEEEAIVFDLTTEQQNILLNVPGVKGRLPLHILHGASSSNLGFAIAHGFGRYLYYAVDNLVHPRWVILHGMTTINSRKNKPHNETLFPYEVTRQLLQRFGRAREEDRRKRRAKYDPFTLKNQEALLNQPDFLDWP